MARDYLIIMGSEDGTRLTLVREGEDLDEAMAQAGLTEIRSRAYLKEQPDTYYWPEGLGVVLALADPEQQPQTWKEKIAADTERVKDNPRFITNLPPRPKDD